MIQKLSVTAFLAMAATMTHAGGYTAPFVEVAPVAAVKTPTATAFWSGAYGGFSAGRYATKVTRKTTIHHPGEEITEDVVEKVWVPTAPEDMFNGCDYTWENYRCPVPVDGTGEWDGDTWTGDWATHVTGTTVVGVTEPYSSTLIERLSDGTNGYGVFAGYRHQYGNNVVTGVELSAAKVDDLTRLGAELQVGYAFNKTLPYAAVGVVQASGDHGTLFAVGVDHAITDQLIVGVRYGKSDIDDLNGAKASTDEATARIAIKF